LKIVHISDSDSGGGAAHAMSRLHGVLRRIGVDSQVLVRNSAAPGNAVEAIATRGDADNLFPAVREAIVRQYVELNRTNISNTHFSLHIDGADVSRVPLVASSDIVHLHWTASFLTPADVRVLLDTKPVVWTLHDFEPLTGGCHFPAGCEGYVDGCTHCPQLVRDPFQVTATTLRDKKTLWSGSGPTFVAPSRYMAERARRSAVAEHAGTSIVHIPHGVDVEAFRPRSKAAARRALGVPEDGLYVLCGSNHNSEKRKGLGVLNRVLAAAKAGSQLKLLTVGEPKLDLAELDGISVFQLGRVSVDLMPLVYGAADVFLHPSGEDNFPCMLLESLSCGIPAIAFDIGGIADIIQDEVCGRLVAASDEHAMAAALSSLLRDRKRLQRMSEAARAHIEEHFSDISIARRHAELYADVAKNRAAPRAINGRSRKGAIEELLPRWSAACLTQELTLANDRSSKLIEESRVKSERIAALEREAAGLALSLADQCRQVQEKEAELAAIYEVATERKALAEKLHASVASIEALAATLQREARERDDLVAKLEATTDEQRAEIELVHGVAADRRLLIEDLHRVAQEQAAVIHRLTSPGGPMKSVTGGLKTLLRRIHSLW
jgi:glycosyltransferase involved in cell wall biosynthesis